MKRNKPIYAVWVLGLLLLYVVIIAFSKNINEKVFISLAFATVSFVLSLLLVLKYNKNAIAYDMFLKIPTWVILGIYLALEFVIATVFSFNSSVVSIKTVVVTNLIIQIVFWILIILTIDSNKYIKKISKGVGKNE